ncbi:hypothetical protein [Sinomonas flava]|uniref:hypothetical protein n=1 Tax=Sinomonas flava TaxID=496857 RepID=UPI0039A4B6A8
MTFAALALMYGVEIPQHVEQRVFGPLSDWTSAIGTLLVGAVIVTMPWPARSPLGATIGRVLVAVVSTAGALGSFLLVTRLMAFVPGTVLAVAGLVAQAIWLALVPRRIARAALISRRMGGVAAWLGGAFLGGLAIVLAGFAVPVPALQWALFIAGGVVGLLGWVGAPIWYLLLGAGGLRHSHS